MIQCANITNGLRITTSGHYTPCCIAGDAFFVDENGEKLSVTKNTFSDALNSPTLKKLREDFKNGIKPKECNGCWNLENVGIESKRQRDNNRVHGLNLTENELYFLEVNMGNICNLSCRICNIHASSNWKREHKTILHPNIGEDELNKIVRSCSDPFLDSSNVWGEIERNIHSVKILDLYGGEPMLMKRQWSILENCVKNNVAKDKYVHFNTNGTIFKNEYFEILKKFKTSDISFSIDGIGEKFNYLRYGADWESVKENILLWLTHTKNVENFKFHICYTVSIMNVLDFRDVVDFAIENNIRIHVNFLYDPHYYSIINIPEDTKKDVQEIIEKSCEDLKETKPLIYNEFMGIIQYMNGQNSNNKDWQDFIRINKLLDISRSQKFEEVFPITHRVLKLNNYVL